MTQNLATVSESGSKPNKSLGAALIQAQLAIRATAKDSHNKFSNYDYTSSETIIEVSREALLNAGILAGRTGWIFHPDEKNPEIACTFIVEHPESGESRIEKVNFPVLEKKGMPMDKAVAAALTTSLAYWFRDLLNIPRPDTKEEPMEDKGIEARNDKEYDPQKRPQAQANQTQQKPAEKKPSVYEGTPEQQRIVQRILEKHNVPENRWDEVHDLLMGRPSTDLKPLLIDLGFLVEE